MAKDEKKNGTEEKAPEPWKAIMTDVAKMMEEALDSANDIMLKFFGKDTVIPTEAINRMAVAIFEATVTAEGGRRMVEAQKELALNPRLQSAGGLLHIGKDGRPKRR